MDFDSSFQNYWIQCVELGRNSDSHIDKRSDWQELIKLRLQNIQDRPDESLFLNVLSNLQSVFDSIEGRDKIEFKKVFNSLPLLFWQLLRSVDFIKQVQKETDDNFKAERYASAYKKTAETAYKTTLSLFISLENILSEKSLQASTLNPAVQILQSKQINNSGREYSRITSLLNPNIKNSVGHERYYISRNQYTFRFNVNHQEQLINMSIYDLIQEIKKCHDGLVDVILAIVKFLDDNNISMDYEWSDLRSDQQVSVMRLLLSTRKISCEKIELLDTFGSKKQLNIYFSGVDLDEDEKLLFMCQSGFSALQLASICLDPDERIYVAYNSPRSLISFCSFKQIYGQRFVNSQITWEEFFKHIIEEGIMLNPTNTDPSPIQKITNYDFEGDGYKVSNIKNPSVENRIRFVADVELSLVKRKNQVKKYAREIVKKLRELQNSGSQQTKVKHGMKLADIVFLNVYQDLNKSKGINSNNDNLICTVQFDSYEEFPIYKDMQWMEFLKTRIEGNFQYRWNEAFFK